MSVVVAELAAKLGLKVDKKSWSVGNDVIAGLGKALAVFAGYKVLHGIADMAKSVIDLGGQLNDTATKTGLSVEALQEYGYIAKQNGSSAEEFTGSVTKLAKSLDEAKNSASPAAEAFRRLGVHVGSQAFKKLTLDEKIDLLAHKLNGVKDPGTRAAIAMQVFGRSASNLLPTYKAIAENGGAMREEFRKLGGELTSGDAAKLDDVGDNIDKLDVAWQGMKQTIVVALLPTITKLVEGLKEWIVANRGVIAEKVVSFVSSLGSMLMYLARAAAFAVEHWIAFSALLGGAMIVTSIVRLIKLVEWLQLASTKAAARTLLAWTIAALPWVLLAAAIAAVIYVVIRFRKQIAAALGWAWDKLKAFGRWIASGFSGAMSGLFGAIRSLGTVLLDSFDKVWEAIKKGARATWEWIKSLPSKAWEALVGENGDGPGAMAQRVLDIERARQAAAAGATMPASGVPARPTGTFGTNEAGGGGLAFSGDINITTPPGGSPDEYRKAVQEGIDDWWLKEKRHAHAGTGVA